MSIGLLIVTHNGIGSDLLATAEHILGDVPIRVDVINIKPGNDYERVTAEVERHIGRLDQGDGVLILTDIFGATPSNIALKAARSYNTKIVAGVNLPMLIRVLNYSNLPLNEIVAKAVSAGHDSIFKCNR